MPRKSQTFQFVHALQRGMLSCSVLRHRDRRFGFLLFTPFEVRLGARTGGMVRFLGHAHERRAPSFVPRGVPVERPRGVSTPIQGAPSQRKPSTNCTVWPTRNL
jgi:hypothetical protein